VGGKADFFVRAATTKLLKQAVEFCQRHGIGYFVLGAGTNLLIPDEGYRGMALKVEMRKIQFEDSTVVAEAGTKLRRLAHETAEKGLAGLEFAEGIPGTVGAAVVMNAGAFGEQIGDRVLHVNAVDCRGRSIKLSHDEMGFGYRSSNLMDSDLIVTEVELALNPADLKSIRRRLEQVRQARNRVQPSEPNAGCVFKNSAEDSAGRLIDGCGLKGLRRGGAQVSEKHANFIINRHNATYADIKMLMQQIINQVHEKYNVALEPEIIDIGEQVLSDR